MRRSVVVGTALLAAALVMLLAVPAGAKKSPPSDHGFPLDQYLRGLVAGKLFVGGAPPKIVGAKTKDTIFVRDGFATYQPQLGFRRAGRDNGHGKFLILKARSWGSALAYVLQLDPGIVKFFRVAFPAAIGGKPFPPLYAKITYTFEVAPDSPSPQFAKVDVASAPHPDKTLRKAGVTLVTFKRGLTPGTYLVRVSAEVSLAPHPLKKLYETYETATGAIEWLSLVGKPAEVVLEKAVEKTVEKLVDRAAKGDTAAAKLLSGPAYREKIVKKKLEDAVKSALTRTEVAGKIEIPTVVPALAGLQPSAALKLLQQRKLRYDFFNDSTQGCGPVNKVKSQSPKQERKVKVGTRVRVRVCRQPTAPTKPTPRGGGALTWIRTGIVLNPAKASPPAGIKVGLTQTHIDYDFTEAPQTEFDIDIDGPPPTRVKPGAPYEFGVSVAGKLTGGKDTQGFRTADAILIVNGRWERQVPARTGQNCNDPIGAAPISCTEPTKVPGVAKLTFPSAYKRGDRFTFGIGLLNCSACYIEYRYEAR